METKSETMTNIWFDKQAQSFEAVSYTHLDVYKRQMEGREEEVQKLDAVIEQQRKAISEHEAKLATEREGLKKQKSSADQRIATIQKDITAARTEREELAKMLRPDVLRKYGTIRMRKGLALSLIHI